VTLRSRSNYRLLCIYVSCTHNGNLVTAGPQVTAGSRDNAHKYFCDRLKTDESRSGWPTFVQSGFASGSVHTRLQVSVYNGYDLCHPVCPKIWFAILTPLTSKSRSNPRHLLHPCQVHPRSKFGDRRSASHHHHQIFIVGCQTATRQDK